MWCLAKVPWLHLTPKSFGFYCMFKPERGRFLVFLGSNSQTSSIFLTPMGEVHQNQGLTNSWSGQFHSSLQQHWDLWQWCVWTWMLWNFRETLEVSIRKTTKNDWAFFCITAMFFDMPKTKLNVKFSQLVLWLNTLRVDRKFNDVFATVKQLGGWGIHVVGSKWPAAPRWETDWLPWCEWLTATWFGGKTWWNYEGIKYIQIYSPIKLWVSPGYCSCQCSSSSTTIFKCYCLSLERYWSWRELQNHFQIALVSWFSFCKPFSSNWQRWKHVWSAFHKSCLSDSTQDPRAVAIHGRVCNFSIHRSCHTFQGFGKVWRVLSFLPFTYIIALEDC